MKKLFIFLILGILLVGTMGFFIFKDKSISTEQDIPVKVLDTEGKFALQEIVLKNPRYENQDLKAIFNEKDFNERIVDFDLKSHPSVDYVLPVGAGNQVVIFYDVNSNLGLMNALGDPEFTDMRTGKRVEREWRYVYWGEAERDVYSCDYTYSANGTRICNSVVTGKETYETWLPYNSRNLPKGTQEIGIEVEVKPNDYIDGVWNVGGKRIDRHAQWIQGSLKAYYKLDETSGTNVIDSHGAYTGVNYNAVINKSGILGRSYLFGDEKWLQFNNLSFPQGMNFTMNVWVMNATGSGATSRIFSGRTDTAGGSDYFSIGTGTVAISMVTYSTDGTSQVTQYTPSLATGQWHMITFMIVHNSTGKILHIYENSVLKVTGVTSGKVQKSWNETWIGKIHQVTTQDFTGFADEISFYNVGLNQTAINFLYGSGTPPSYPFVIPKLEITLLSPENNIKFTTNNINFSVNVSDPNLKGIKNVTINVYDNNSINVFNETNTSGFEGIYNFSSSFADGNYSWNATAYDDSNEFYESSARVFTIDLVEPTVTLLEPANATQTMNDSITFKTELITGNYTLNNATINVWFNNGTLFATQTNDSINGNSDVNITFNVSGLSLLFGKIFLWNILLNYENPVLGTFNSVQAPNNWTFTILAFQEDETIYSPSVIETTTQNFKLRIIGSSHINSVSGKLWYNGTGYTSTIQDGTAGKYNLTNTLDVPLSLSASDNKSLFWQLDFTFTGENKLQQNSSFYYQQVNKTYLFLCNATYPTQFINFTTRNSENPFPKVNSTFKSAWGWYVKGATGNVKRNMSYENLTETKNEYAFCGSPNITFVTDIDIEYDSSAFAKNFYYIMNAELSNSTQSIDLYLLNDSKATVTVVKIRDAVQNPIEDVLIQIQLYDIGTDTFKTVGMGKSSYTGEEIVYLNWYDSLYKFILIQNGSVVKSTTPFKIVESPQIFEIKDVITFSYDKFRNFQYEFYYNNETKNFVFTFTKPSGLVESACLRVVKRTGKNDTLICNPCETSSSATLYCNIGSYGNGTFVADIYATGSLWSLDNIVQVIGKGFAEEIYDLLGVEDATAYAFLFSGIVVAMFLITPALGIIGAMLGLVGASALGFTLTDWTIYAGIIIVGGLIIWLLKR